MNIGTNLDLHGNQIQNFVLQTLAADPVSPVTASPFYNSGSNVIKYHDGTTMQTVATLNDLNSLGAGDMVGSNNLSDVASASAARSNLGVDEPGTDNSTNVTLTGANYLSLNVSTQVLTAQALTTSNLSDFTSSVNTAVANFLDTAAGANDALDTAAEFISKIQANADLLAQLPQRHNELIGDGSATSFAVTHNMGTANVIADIWEVATGEKWIVDQVITSNNVITFNFGTVVPTADQFNVVIRD